MPILRFQCKISVDTVAFYPKTVHCYSFVVATAKLSNLAQIYPKEFLTTRQRELMIYRA